MWLEVYSVMDNFLSASYEDYLEIILSLSADKQAVRITDIAGRMNIAKSSVSQAVSNLKDLGLVTQEHYGKVYLTPKGLSRALAVKKRHKTLKTFLKDVLEVQEDIADKDACLMEHAISPETLEKLIDFVKKQSQNK